MLLNDGRLLVIDARTGTTVLDLPRPANAVSATQGEIVHDRSSRKGWVLFQTGIGSMITEIDPTSLASRRLALGDGNHWVSLAFGPTSGRLYLFGATNTTVDVVEPSTTSVVEHIEAPAHSDVGLLVYRGAVSPDETRLFVSYHAESADGVDILQRRPSGWTLCDSRPRATSGCLRAHGDIVAVPGALFFATGGSQIGRYEFVGRTSTFDSGLPERNHMVEFAVDERAQLLYTVGQCDYAGGLSVSSIRNPAARGPGRPLEADALTVCGDRISVSPDGGTVAVVSSDVGNDLRAGLANELVLVDAATGRVAQRVSLPTPPIAVDLWQAGGSGSLRACVATCRS